MSKNEVLDLGEHTDVATVETDTMGKVTLRRFHGGTSEECLMLITDKGEIEIYAKEVLDLRKR